MLKLFPYTNDFEIFFVAMVLPLLSI